MSTLSFNAVVSRLKTSIRHRLKSDQFVSALDVSNVMRNASNNSSRGAAMRRAFADLIEEGVLAPTSQTEYNRDTHHRVTVYRAR